MGERTLDAAVSNLSAARDIFTWLASMATQRDVRHVLFVKCTPHGAERVSDDAIRAFYHAAGTRLGTADGAVHWEFLSVPGAGDWRVFYSTSRMESVFVRFYTKIWLNEICPPGAYVDLCVLGIPHTPSSITPLAVANEHGSNVSTV